MCKRWADIGLDPLGMITHLLHAGVARAAYERSLRDAGTSRRLHQQAERASRLFHRASPVIAFLKAESDFFGSLGHELEARLVAYIDETRKRSLTQPTQKLAAHRPGERWLTEYVVQILPYLRAAGVTWAAAGRILYDSLVLAGHEQAVTIERIRRRIKVESKRLKKRASPRPLRPLHRAADQWADKLKTELPYIRHYARGLGL
jgi:hypothetical protein